MPQALATSLMNAFIPNKLLYSALTLSTLLLGACSGIDETNPDNWSPNKLLTEAREQAEVNQTEKAADLYERLQGRAAGTPLEQQAQIERAYAYYLGGEPARATATIDAFLKLHPDSPALDYALYLKGVVNMQDQLGIVGNLSNQDIADRDQNRSKVAYHALEELVQRFPNSQYSGEARLRINSIVNALARYEIKVARFYYDRRAYVAAIQRAQAAIVGYRDVPALEEAIFILYKSYEALQLSQLRDDIKRVMENSFPDSDYLKTGFKEKSLLASFFKFF